LDSAALATQRPESTRPAEQAAIEVLGTGEVWGRQINPDHLADVMLATRRIVKRRNAAMTDEAKTPESSKANSRCGK